MANRDANYVQVGLGKSTTSGTLPLQIDHVTDRLMVEIHRVASDSGSLVQNRASKDANYSNTMTGASNTSTVVTPLTVKGGVVRVIDSATGDVARTTNGAIEDEKYGIYLNVKAANISGEFDSAVTRTGRLTLKVSTTDITGRVWCVIGDIVEPANIISLSRLTKYAIPIKPSTSYKFSCYAKTNNTTASGVFTAFRLYDATGTRIDASGASTNTLSGSNDWTLLTKTFTSGSTCVYLTLSFILNNNAGNISDAWFDVNSMTLEEVSSITNSGSFPALFYPKVTAVSSTDNIDQSQAGSNNGVTFGDNGANQKLARSFVPTKKNLTGVVIRKTASTGTYTGNVTISIQSNATNKPDNIDLVSVTIPNATWEAISDNTDYTVALPLTLTVGDTYYIVFSSSTQYASNHPNYRGDSATGGRFQFNGTTWGTVQATYGAYFKTLYSKNTDNFTVSTDTQTVSVTAPTTDGWANGTVVDTATIGITPLTLAVGANAVYYSSNGPAYADGTVDASLQGTFSGSYENNNNNSNILAVAANSVNGFPIVDLVIE